MKCYPDEVAQMMEAVVAAARGWKDSRDAWHGALNDIARQRHDPREHMGPRLVILYDALIHLDEAMRANAAGEPLLEVAADLSKTE